MKNITIMLLMLFLGCASVGHKLDQEAVSKIKKGETTKKEVLALIGSPDQIVNLGNGDTSWSYTY